jgi:hypothetical protein
MTSQEFESKYKVLKQIAGGAGRSYTAQERPSGRAVLVHVFESLAAGEEVGSLVERLPPRDRARVLETLTVDESLVFVTQVLEGFRSFEGWLGSRAVGATDPLARPAPPAHPPADQGSAGGEFTELFRSPERPSPAQEPGPGKLPPEKTPAGFTDLFSAPPARPPSPPRQPISVPPVRVVDLRLPKPQLAGEDREPAPPPLRPNLGGATQPPATPMAPPAPRALGDQVIAAPDPRPVSPPPRPAWSGPSDFTRQLERGPHLGSDAPPVLVPLEPPDPPAGKKTPIWPLLLATNLISMLVTGLIVYFAFGRD